MSEQTNPTNPLLAALEKCRDQFQFYANEHTAAGKLEKAATNQRFADLASTALSSAPSVGEVEIERAECAGMDKAATYCIETLAKALDVDDWQVADGSETWDGDVAGTIYNVLIAGRIYDDEDGRVARLEDAHPTAAVAGEGERCATCGAGEHFHEHTPFNERHHEFISRPAGDALRTAEKRGEQRAIARIVNVSRAIGWQAGVGGRETAGAIISYLATSPDEIAPFVAGELSPLDFAGDWMRGGCLTWQAVNGNVVSPEDLASTKSPDADGGEA